jgi:hypothetical protein
MGRAALTEYLLAWLAGEGAGPHEISRARLALSTNPSATEGPEALSVQQADRLAQALLACRVCDPAAGDGALLVAMLEEMHALASRLSPDSGRHPALKRQLASRLYGADIREDAVRRCRSRLRRAAREPGDEGETEQPPDLCRQIVCADSLLGRPFDDLEGGPGFDIVLANPPYVSFGLRGTGAARAAWARAVRQRYPRSAEYKLSSYAVFMDRGLSLTRPGGVFCCLTPDSYLLGRYFRKLRRRILDDSAIRTLVLIEEDFWEGAVVGRPVIGVFRNGKRPGERPVLTAARCRMVDDLASGKGESCPCPQDDFERLRHHRFRLLFSEEDRRFVAAVERGAGRLGDVVSFASGLIGRHGRDSIVADTRRGPTWRPGIDSGADVQPYRVRYRGKFLNFDPRALKSGFRDARYEGPKLMLRQTGDALVAAHDPDGLYCLNNVHVGNATETGVDVRLVVAILNSALMNRYYRLISLEAGRALAQIDLDVVEDLPCKRPSAEDERRAVELVARLQSGLPPLEEGEAVQELEVIIHTAYGLSPHAPKTPTPS